jgi:exopolysaccharide biosynthesis polyprenyl glycosylphosphotransferase
LASRMSALEVEPSPERASVLEVAPRRVAGRRRFALSLRERRVVLAIGDFAVAALASWLVYVLIHRPNAHPLEFYDPLIIGALWVLSLVVTDGYASQIPSNRLESGVAVIKALPISALLTVLVFFLHPYVLTRPVIVGALVVGALGLIVMRTTVARALLHESLATQVVVVTDSDVSADLSTALRAARYEYRVMGTVVGATKSRVDARRLVDEVTRVLNESEAEEVIVSSNELRLVPGLVEQCLTHGVRLVSGGTLVETYMGRVPIDTIDVHWYLELPASDVWRRPYAAARRIFDLLLAFAISIPFAVLLPFIALATKLDSPGPVFLVQRRIGENGREFSLLKLRTMRTDAEAEGAQFAARRDPRVTRVGRLLRATRLDEFPQLINIVRGEMSFIGPRPERPEFERDLEAKIPHFRSRLLVKPGLTGWAQIKSGYASTLEDMTRKLEYDLFYIKNRSFRLDLQILAGTFGAVVGWRGR